MASRSITSYNACNAPSTSVFPLANPLVDSKNAGACQSAFRSSDSRTRFTGTSVSEPSCSDRATVQSSGSPSCSRLGTMDGSAATS
jgi:hypothetical protein